MPRKSDNVSLKQLQDFSHALSVLSLSVSNARDTVEKNKEEGTQSTNWSTAIRGLAYIERFASGLAGTAMTGPVRSFLEKAEADEKQAKAASEANAANKKASKKKSG